MQFLTFAIAHLSPKSKIVVTDSFIKLSASSIPLTKGEFSLSSYTTLPALKTFGDLGTFTPQVIKSGLGVVAFTNTTIAIASGRLGTFAGIITKPTTTWGEFSLSSDTTIAEVRFGELNLGGSSTSPLYEYSEATFDGWINLLSSAYAGMVFDGWIAQFSYEYSETTFDGWINLLSSAYAGMVFDGWISLLGYGYSELTLDAEIELVPPRPQIGESFGELAFKVESYELAATIAYLELRAEIESLAPPPPPPTVPETYGELTLNGESYAIVATFAELALSGYSYAIAATISDLGDFTGWSNTTISTPSNLTELSAIFNTPHVDTVSLYKRIVANSGSVSWTDLDIIETNFILPMYAQSLRTICSECWIPIGNNLAAVAVKLWYPTGVTDKLTLINFVEADYVRTEGLTGDGSSKYAKTGFIPSANLTASAVTVGVYTKTETSAAQMDLYAQSSSTSALGLITKWSDGKIYWDCNNTTANAGRISTTSTTLLPGFKVGTRISTSNTRIRRNGTSVATGTGSGGTLPTHEFYLHAGNNAGVAMNFSSKTIGMYLIGTNWTLAQDASINTIVQNTVKALGRS